MCILKVASSRARYTGRRVGIGPASSGSNCTYYSNASHTTVVGQFGKDCCNNPVAWGIKTKYSVCGGCFVCLPPPR
jgi:hypothetical protein